MNKHFQFISIIFLGICFLLSSWLISESLENKDIDSLQNTSNRYEFITIASDYFIIFDKQTGEYWGRVGSSEWEKQQSILKETSK